MRDIRAKIAQRHGIELTDQQVQELAARRLESILDPRTLKPSLLEQLRRSAGTHPDTVAAADRATVPYEFEDTTLYDSPNTLTRAIRRLLNPILKLFFNPNPLIRALNIQSRLNIEATRREAERDQRQAEWNALHYEILQRVVSEVSKVSLEVQSLALRAESLSTKVDFNERRVRTIEGAAYHAREGGRRDRDREREAPLAPPPPPVPAEATTGPTQGAPTETADGEAPRRRRRRRRGRRGGGGGEAAQPVAGVPWSPVAEAIDGDEIEEGDADSTQIDEASEALVPESEAISQAEGQSASAPQVSDAAAPERVTPQLASVDPTAREEAAPGVPTPPALAPEPDSHEPQ